MQGAGEKDARAVGDAGPYGFAESSSFAVGADVLGRPK